LTRFASFVGVGIGDEGAGLVGGGELAVKIEIHAAENRGVVAARGRVNLQRVQPIEDEAVNFVRDRRGIPDEVGLRGDECEPDSDLAVEKADGNRDFARALGSDATTGGHFGELGRGFVDGERSDVAVRSVGECGEGVDLHRGTGQLDDLFNGSDGQFGEGRDVAVIRSGAGGDPLPENRVFERRGTEAEAAAMGDLLGGFLDKQATMGLSEVDSPSRQLADEGDVVRVRVVATERELESSFAGGIAMTSAGVASGF
jgi:hypothetical protein